LLIVDRDRTDLSVHLEEYFSLTSLLGYRSNSKQLDNQDLSVNAILVVVLYLALLQLDVEFLANLGFAQEISSRKNTEITVFLNYLTILFVNLGILSITGHIGFVSGSEFLLKVKSDLLQIERFQGFSRSFSQLLTTSTEDLMSALAQEMKNHLRSQRFRETSVWLTHKTLEEIQY
jgi:hypothetical protein